MQICVVYWLFDDTCTDPLLHGYVGLTKELPRRVTEHRRRFGKAFQVKVLFSGTRAECYAEERRLRPQHSIGWNMIAGGLADRIYPPSVADKISNGNKGKKRSAEWAANLRAKLTGRKHTPEAIARMCVAQKGHAVSARSLEKAIERNKRPRSPEYLANMSAGQQRRTYTEEQRAVLSAASKGRTRSSAHKAAIADANRRRVVSEETRAKMRIAAKRRMTPEVRAKLSAAKRRYYQERSGEPNSEGQVF